MGTIPKSTPGSTKPAVGTGTQAGAKTNAQRSLRPDEIARAVAEISFENFNIMQAKRAIIVAIFACIVATAETGVIAYMALKEQPNSVIAIDMNGNVTTIENLTAEVTTASVTMFATEALGHLLSFDFKNYKTQIEAAQPFFTKAGWISITDAIAPIVGEVVQGQFVTSIGLSQPVVLTKTAVVDGNRRYKINTQLSLGYVGQSKMTVPTLLDVELVIVSAPRKQFARGILIQSINMKPASR